MIYINPNFIKKTQNNPILSVKTTHFNPLFFSSRLIHMNPQFLLNLAAEYWSIVAKDNTTPTHETNINLHTPATIDESPNTTPLTQDQVETRTQAENIRITIAQQSHSNLPQERIVEEALLANVIEDLSPSTGHNNHTLVSHTQQYHNTTFFKTNTTSSKVLSRRFKVVHHKRLNRNPFISPKSYKLDNKIDKAFNACTTSPLPKTRNFNSGANCAPRSSVSSSAFFGCPYGQNKKCQLKNINGVMYKLTRNSLQRKDLVLNNTKPKSESTHSNVKINAQEQQSNQLVDFKSKLPQGNADGLLHKSSPGSDTSTWTKNNTTTAHENCAKQYSAEQLRKRYFKNNVPCVIFQRTGKCAAQELGRCNKKHDKQQVVICSKFLRGECENKNCLLSHNASYSKMPVCKFYLRGTCVREKCQYLHKKLNSKTDVCEDFLRGFCKLAEECEKRHVFVCPQYERNGECNTKNCIYCKSGRDRLKRNNEKPKCVKSKSSSDGFVKNNKKSDQKELPVKTGIHSKSEVVKNRYFLELSKANEIDVDTNSKQLVDPEYEVEQLKGIEMPNFIPI
ncbi:zinc finger CCCH domain-containing protein 3-like isoform X1 [Teleopsis dalmanni]|uniref:zinc finger CCCH domain-containing protein 3-like isoform X1 n=1 Tax=Teleopsis dalmanni TaxID=139649 RepID=UPI0018CEE6D4|nr:zinc finger CCCH domain-containing protein 3-like isoform X1 [Teleopsis dalmanni]